MLATPDMVMLNFVGKIYSGQSSTLVLRLESGKEDALPDWIEYERQFSKGNPMSTRCLECDDYTLNCGNGKCNVCHGTGIGNIFDPLEILGVESGCDRCGGTGVCPQCNGDGFVDD